jgi:hypothetical protein
MAKNPGRGNKIFRRNTIPNLVGQDLSTAQSTLTSLGFNSNVSSENTGDNNLNNKVKSQSLIGEAAIGTSVDLVRYTFSFAPFGAFGFTPFGFTPFGFTPFGFTPFGFTPSFGFTPWGTVGCIHGDTLIKTVGGEMSAKDVQVGDKVLTVDINEIPLEDYSSNDWDWRSVSIESLTIPEGFVEATITNVVESEKQEVVWFNGEENKKYSLTQPIFVKDSPYYIIKEAGNVRIDDVLIQINSNGAATEIPVTLIETDDSGHTVYQFSCEPQDWFIAGNYLVHNK